MHEHSAGYTLSEYERLALTNRVNLSDGHARNELTEQQRSIVGRTLELLDESQSRQREDVEEEFLRTFFRCAAQNRRESITNAFLTFSSSSAIKMAAQYCRLRKLRVYLIEPCFDNIVHLLRTEGVEVCPVSEAQLGDLDTLERLFTPTSALWLVQPNNPTGFCLDRDSFQALVRRVAARRVTLVVDFCFRLYADCLRTWDQYEVLTESQSTFLCFEDTGKTWALADTKVGVTVCSDDAADTIYRLHDELLLNVSPLHLLLLTEFIKNTIQEGFQETVMKPIERNRSFVHSLVNKGLVLHATESCHNVPMELLSLPYYSPAIQFWKKLRRLGVDILPAHNYYWSKVNEGTSLFRMPLSRPHRDFDIAIPLIEQVLCETNAA